jgi:hypothetical protein
MKEGKCRRKALQKEVAEEVLGTQPVSVLFIDFPSPPTLSFPL